MICWKSFMSGVLEGVKAAVVTFVFIVVVVFFAATIFAYSFTTHLNARIADLQMLSSSVKAELDSTLIPIKGFDVEQVEELQIMIVNDPVTGFHNAIRRIETISPKATNSMIQDGTYDQLVSFLQRSEARTVTESEIKMHQATLGHFEDVKLFTLGLYLAK